jgi:hypothetical protein
MRLSRLVPSILLIGSGVGAATFLSATRAADHQMFGLTGTIASIDTLSLRVRVGDEGNVMAFIVDDATSLPAGLITGARVSVSYERRQGGGRRLLSVRLAVGAPTPTIGAAETPSLKGARSTLDERVALGLLLATATFLVISPWRSRVRDRDRVRRGSQPAAAQPPAR